MIKKRFEAYMKAVNDHDIEKALTFLSENFKLTFTDYDFSIDKKGFVDVLGWDKGVNGRISWKGLEVEGYSIKGRFTEQNDFFRLIGIDGLQATMVYWFNTPGLIVKQAYTPLSGQPSSREKMQPAVEWAKKNRPEELKAIYPQGQMQYNQEMGERWVALLKEWKAATGA